MDVLVQLFVLFAKLSTFAFGGGYVIIGSLIQESEKIGWASAGELANVIAIAGMSPGPVAMNAAVAYGYKIAGIQGAVASLFGIAIPCAIIVIFVARFFFEVYQHRMVYGALYALRAVITGIIIYAAVSLTINNGIVVADISNLIDKGINFRLFGFNLFELKSVVMIIICFIVLMKTKIHPIFIILMSGVSGALIFI